MRDDPLLTQDELKFIREMLDAPSMGTRIQVEVFREDGQRMHELLCRLAEKGQLQLYAELGRQQVRFPLQVAETGGADLRFDIGPPRIIENRGPVIRSWRMMLSPPVPLVDAEGIETRLVVHQISPSGMSIETAAGPAPPKTFRLLLPLEGHEPMTIEATLARRLSPRSAAYRIRLSETDIDSLREHIFRHHQQWHQAEIEQLPVGERSAD